MAEHDPVEALLAQHNAEAEPPGDWQAKVWAEIAREQAPQRRWGWWVGGLLAAVGAAALVFALTRPGAAPLAFTVQVQDGAGQVRSTGTKRGDVLHLTATLGGAGHGEIRVYRDGDPWLVCPGAEGCQAQNGQLTVQAPMDTVGRYQPLLITADAPLKAPVQSLESDLAQLRQAGARVETAPPIDVY